MKQNNSFGLKKKAFDLIVPSCGLVFDCLTLLRSLQPDTPNLASSHSLLLLSVILHKVLKHTVSMYIQECMLDLHMGSFAADIDSLAGHERELVKLVNHLKEASTAYAHADQCREDPFDDK